MNMNKPLRYAVIGTGGMANLFAATAVPQLHLSAVYSRKYETGKEFSKHFGGTIDVFTDINSLALSDVADAVYIATPNSLHYHQSRLFLENGKHVLCEKPVSVKPTELYELQRISEEKGLVFLEAMMLMHQPERSILKQAIAEIGHVREAHLRISQLSSRYPALLSGTIPIIFDPEFAGGALMDLGVYCANAAVDLFGLPISICARSILLKCGVDASGAAILDYDDKLVTLEYSKTGQGIACSEIIGDAGTVTIDLISLYGGIRLHRNGVITMLSDPYSHTNALKHEMVFFVNTS